MEQWEDMVLLLGGSSGAGSINIFYKEDFIKQGNITANGAQRRLGNIDAIYYGGAGGDGCISIGSIVLGYYEEREN